MMLLWLLVCAVTISLTIQSIVQAATEGSPETLTTVLGQALILITTISGFAYTLYRESRQRRWDLEDRARARKDLAATLVGHEKAQIERAAAVKDVILDKIDENTQISREAFKEANDVNRKIEQIGRQI